MKDNNKKDVGNMFDMMSNMRQTNFYEGKVEDGEWKEDTSAKLKFKIYMVILAAIMIGATFINYNYLGGMEGILNGTMLEEEGIRSYIAGVGSIVVLPLLAIFFLWLGFKKKKKD